MNEIKSWREEVISRFKGVTDKEADFIFSLECLKFLDEPKGTLCERLDKLAVKVRAQEVGWRERLNSFYGGTFTTNTL